MQLLTCAFVFALLGVAHAAENEPCVGEAGRPGVCIAESDCSSKNGMTISGACPRDAANIKCCTKATCDTGTSNKGLDEQLAFSGDPGNCHWLSDCKGSSTSGQCPGPSDFKCCASSDAGFGGYDQPPKFGKGSCKQVAIDGAQKIVDQFPGRVREIGCIRTGSACDVPKPSDHCSGMATDMMCSDAGGKATISGREIAEWVNDNRALLNLKYVIWGQRIWERDDPVKDWEDWRTLEDRGSITKNHWDHVHVSYKD